MHHLRRRTVLGSGLATVAMAPATKQISVPARDSLTFRVMRHGAQIGLHTVSFRSQSDGGLDVRFAVNVLVKMGPIPLGHYAHHGSESWREGRIANLQTHTNRNGTELQMRAWRTGAGLEVEGTDTAPYVAPPNALPTSYWNRRMLDGPMIGTQKGSLVTPKVTDLGVASIPLANGGTVAVRHYGVHGPGMDVDVYYDTQQIWAGLSFTIVDGSLITYERL